MHILLLPSEYPTNDHKLGGIFTFEQEKYLKKNNKIGVIYIYLFSLKKFFSSLFLKIFYFKKKGNKKFFFYFPRIPYVKQIKYYLHFYFFLFVFVKYIKINGKPDLIHVHFSEFSIYTAYKIKKIYNIPYVVTEHSTDFLDGKYKSNYKINSKIYKKIFKAFNNSKKIICVSSILKKNIKRHYKIKDNKFSIIPNLSLNINYKSKNKKTDIIFVGSFEKRKNPLLLIKAFKKVYKKKLKMRLIGDGELKKEMSNYINKNNLNKYVTLFSNIGRKSVLKMIADSKLLVLPSYFETFGVVVIEAYSMGIPVLMTDSLGVRDLHNSNCSRIIKKINSQYLSNEINDILKNYKMYNKSFIKNYYKKNFSPSVVIKKIEAVYRS